MPFNDKITPKQTNTKNTINISSNKPIGSQSKLSNNKTSANYSNNRLGSSLSQTGQKNNGSALNSAKTTGNSKISSGSGLTSSQTYNHKPSYNNNFNSNQTNNSSNNKNLASNSSLNQKPTTNTALNKKEKNKNNKSSFVLFFKNFFNTLKRKFKSSKFRVGTVASLLLIITMVSIYAGLHNSLISIGKIIETFYNSEQLLTTQYDYDLEKKSLTEVGYYGQVIGTTTRDIPDRVLNEGMSEKGYPTYGYTMGNLTTQDKDKIIYESSYLTPTGTWNGGAGGYTWIDSQGFLYSGTTSNPIPTKKNNKHRRLYKHTSAVGLYHGNVSDDEQGIIKKVTYRPLGYDGYTITGVYAPAGEVVKITLSKKDMDATGGIKIHVGQALFNGKANNIWSARNINRFPVIMSTYTLDKNTTTYDAQSDSYIGYVGSFVGGPIYIRNESVTFSAILSGGVAYSHFILGSTSKEEFEKNAKTSTPFFDLQVWSYGMLISGPKIRASRYSYEDIYKVANLWEKVASVTTTNSNQGISMLFDPFVAAGAAVAFPGQRAINCPDSWMTDALNYNGIITSGSWGNFHEYHHNFQGYGVGNGGEVTNNAMTLVSYALFTKISANRGKSNYGSQGLGGWNNYTSATWALDQTLRIKNNGASNGNQGLALYATLLHNFGPDAFIKAKVKQQQGGYGQNYQGYLNAWQEITHNDLTYYFTDILCGLTTEIANKYKNSNYSNFVPISCLYQTGRSYLYKNIENNVVVSEEKKYISTMQPYVINYGEPFQIDLNKYTISDNLYEGGSIVLPEGFSYTIKNVRTEEGFNGTLTNNGGNIYTYTPESNLNKLKSGKIYVTLALTKDDNAFQVDDIDLVLEFEQSMELKRSLLKRTVYTYSENNVYTDASEAFENNYAGYENKETTDNVNSTQNSNTDIWQLKENVPANSVAEVYGKLYINETGKYRIAIRGRWNVALYVSLDNGKTYEKACSYIQDKTRSKSANFPLTPGTYKDFDNLKENTWVYFKAVLINETALNTASFIGVGWGKFTPATIAYDDEGNIIQNEDGTDKIIPESVSISYANAYRPDYVFTTNNNQFETDFFYTRKYSYSYSEDYSNTTKKFEKISVVENTNTYESAPIENIFDDDPNNYASSAVAIDSAHPWSFTIDLGEEITANRFVLTGNLYNGAGNKNQTPKNISIYLSKTPNEDDFIDMATLTTANLQNAASGTTIQFNFDTTTFRYYKIIVKQTVEGRFGAIKNISFKYNINNGNHLSLHNDIFTISNSSEWKGFQTISSFGHVFVSKNDYAQISFKFTGTRFLILSSNKFNDDYLITIDGIKLDSAKFTSPNNEIRVSYLSETLELKEHTVNIICKNNSNIDSIVLF